MLNAKAATASAQACAVAPVQADFENRDIGSLDGSKTGAGAGGALAAGSLAKAGPAALCRAGTLVCRSGNTLDELINTFAQRGDLAHHALFLWASAVTALLIFVTRELAAAMRRFDDFVRELARFNDRLKGKK
jgi:hypothetical protein